MTNANAYALKKSCGRKKGLVLFNKREKDVLFCQREGPLGPQDTVCHNLPTSSPESILRPNKA
jgi:hypothetical protein